MFASNALGLRHPRVSHTFRPGLTMLELLIAIGVIGLLAALILPALQYMREASRKVQCRSQLRQIMIATQDYAITNTYYPGSFRSHWVGQIITNLGYPEKTAQCPIYACPSDPDNATGVFGPYGNGYYISYSMCSGTLTPDGMKQGVFGLTKNPVRPSDVRDGYSSTVAYGEHLSVPWFAPAEVDWKQHKSMWNRVPRRIHRNPTEPEDYYQECHNDAGSPALGWFMDTLCSYNHIMPPNDNNCFVVPGPEYPVMKGPVPAAVTASSLHPGGVHVAMLDGSVKFVTNGIDRKLWRAISTIHGKEVHDSF